MPDRRSPGPPRGLPRKVAAISTRRVSATDRTASEHLRSLVDDSTTCIYVKDAAGRYLLGRGFDPRVAAARRLGLLGMEQRAIAVGGELRGDSAPGRGTSVTFTCPLATGAEP